MTAATFRSQRLVDPTALCGPKLAEAAESEQIAKRTDNDDVLARGRRVHLRIATMCPLIWMRHNTHAHHVQIDVGQEPRELPACLDCRGVVGTVGLGARGEQAGGVELVAGNAGFVGSVPV